MEPILDLDLLRTFVAVCRTGELQKAAQAVHRSKGAVSMQIKRLEELTNSHLLERSNKGISLTQAGETLLSYSEQLLKLNSAAMTAMKGNDQPKLIRFGIPTDYAQNFLKFFMPLLAEAFPQLEARVVCDRSRNLRPMIAAGDLDIAIVSGESENSDEMQLWSERLIWSAPLGSPLEEQAKLPIAQLECDCILRDVFLADLKRAEIPYQVVFSSPVVDNLASAVEENLAITLLPESVLHANRTRKVPSNLIKSNRTLSINMIYRPEIDDTTLETVSACMRQASNNQRHTVNIT